MLKEISMFGGVQIIRLSLGLVRNKMIALYFGATGLGIWALFLTFTEMCQQLISMGLDKAAIKNISENKDALERQRKFIKLLQACLIFNSIIIFSIIIINSKFVDEVFFKAIGSKTGVYIALYVLLNCNSICLSTILNGLRETKLYSYAQLYSVIISNLVIISFIPLVNVESLVYLFLIQAIVSFAFHLFFYLRLKLSIDLISLNFKIEKSVVLKFLVSGVGFWLPGIYLAFSEYIIRVYMSNELDTQAVGIYQACWTISNMYIGIILSSMIVSFYPRICQVVDDKVKVNNLLNKQVSLGLTMSTPFLLIIFLFSDYILIVLYSSEFELGKEIIQWQIIGVCLRLLGFAFGYALMAKGETKKYIISQFVFVTTNMILTIYMIKYMEFNNLGVSYLVSYTIYLFLMVYFNYKIFDFLFEFEVLRRIFIAAIFFVVCMLMVKFLDGVFFISFSIILVLISFITSYKDLKGNHGLNISSYLLRSK